MKLRNKHDSDPEWDKEHKKWEKKSAIVEKQDLIMDEGLETNYPTQEEIIAYNRKEYNNNKRKDRIVFLQQQIAAEARLDGWTLKGAKEELKRLEEENEGLTEIN